MNPPTYLQPHLFGCPQSFPWIPVTRPARWLALLVFALAAFVFLPRVSAQSYGPPKIAYYGALRSFSGTGEWTAQSEDGNGGTIAAVAADFYGGGLAVVQDGYLYSIDGNDTRTLIGWYDSASVRFLDLSNGEALPGVAPVDGNENFMGSESSVIAITAAGSGAATLYHWAAGSSHGPDYSFTRSESGVFVAKFVGVPDGAFQLQASWSGSWSPPYIHAYPSQAGYDQTSSDGWPGAGMSLAGPPATMYVNGQAYTKGTPGVTHCSEGYYSETHTYGDTSLSNLPGYSLWVSRDTDGNHEAFGAVWAPGMTGTLNPYTLAVTSLSNAGAPGSISFSAPTGSPARGPNAVTWAGTTVLFRYTATVGSDVYWDDVSGKLIWVTPTPSSARYCTAYAHDPTTGATWSGTYDAVTGAFSAGSPLAAIDGSGNLLGTPPGVVAFFAEDPGMVTLYSADGSSLAPTYSWRTPSQAWAVKFVTVPPRPFVLSGPGTSPAFHWVGPSGGDLVVSTSSWGWAGSNMHPPTVYVNAVAFTRFSEQLEPSATHGWGTAVYALPTNGSPTLSLNWTLGGWISNWNGSWSYSEDDGNGNTQSAGGWWDGGNGFSGPGWPVVSFTPPSTAPRHGPQRIAWDGAILTYDSVASFMAGGDDVYRDASGNVSVRIGADGIASVSNTVTGVTGQGTYHFATRRFDFGPSFTGVVQALNVGEELLGDTNIAGDINIAGSLDVRGSTFNFATTLGNLNKPAFAWLHRSAPIVPGGPSGNHLRWLTATSLYQWTWEAPTSSAGYYAPLMSLRSHPFPTLAMSVPITNPAGPVVIGSYHDVAVLSGVGPSGNRATGVFVVAAGNKVGNVITPRNALRVTDDGTVLIQPGGDISMGEFTAGPQP